MVALIEDSSGLDMKWLAEHSPYALVVLFIVWLLYWIPKWVDAWQVRVDAALGDRQRALDDANRRHGEWMDTSNQRHERLIEAFHSENEKERSVWTAQFDRVYEGLSGKIDKLEDKFDRRAS